jgi:hypothetical protein
MGLYLFSSSSYDRRGRYYPSEPAAPPALPLPNPTRYRILQHRQVGTYLVVRLRYLDCTNYEGQKILLYEGCTLAQLKRQGALDPHFSENPRYLSPIARFVPTTAGWTMALGLALGLQRHAATKKPPAKR